MTLHLYALTGHPASLPDGVRAVEIDGLDAVVGDTGTDATEEAVLEHARIVDELTAENDAVLPARFGAGYAGEHALVDAIRGRKEQLRAALEHVRDCVEIGLRVFDEEHAAVTGETGSGREYMHRRLDAVRGAERLAEDLHGALASRARDSTCRVLASPELVLSAAYLLPRDALESFRSTIEDAERERPELAFVCTGPWPPYSFAMVGEQES